MLSSPHDSLFILVLCVYRIFAKFWRGHPRGGAKQCLAVLIIALFVPNTGIPHLKYPPTLQAPRTTASEMTIMWPSWSGYVDPSIGLRYQVEYKLSDYHGGNESGVWRPGPVVENTGSAQQVATVLDLRRNSFYEFRTLPILRVGEQDVRGIISPQSGPFRTKCHGVYFFCYFHLFLFHYWIVIMLLSFIDRYQLCRAAWFTGTVLHKNLCTTHLLMELRTFLPLLSVPFSCLRRTWWDGVKEDVKCPEGQLTNPDSPGRMTVKPVCDHVCVIHRACRV